MTYLKTFYEILKATFEEWNEDGVPMLAAALAFYTAVSLAPLLIVALAIVGLIANQDTVQAQILQQIEAAVGANAAAFIQTLIENTAQIEQGIISTILGVGALLFGALGLFNQLQNALDRIWDAEQIEREGGIKGFLRDRLLSFGMVLVVGFLLLVSLILSTLLSFVDSHLFSALPGTTILLRLSNEVISFGMTTVLFMLIFKILPHAYVRWRDVGIGAMVTALLFTVGRVLLGLYLGNSSIASTYGAAGAFVLILFWVYYSAQILLFGAEFTQVFARRFGSKIAPAEKAGINSESDTVPPPQRNEPAVT